MKITEVELLSADLEGTEKFYAGTMGFKVESKSAKDLKLKIGSSFLTFKKTDVKNPVYHFAFEIPNNLLEEAIEWADGKLELVQFDKGSVIADFAAWNASSIYFYDNNGNIVELIARFDNKTESNETFDASCILNVSEIGLVAQNVAQLCKEIKIKTSVTLFSRQKPRDDFAVAGDNNGLFIVVLENRRWFATQIRARRFPVKVKIDNEGEIITYHH